jgi:hypothetical protein
MKIEEQFRKLKNLIELERYEEVKGKFDNYIKNSVNGDVDSARFKIICWIN